MTANERKDIEEQIKTLEGLAKSERDYAARAGCWIRRDAAISRARKYEAQAKELQKTLKGEK